ncbi:MAG: HlyD family secretion protein [Blastomonas sp.]
MTDRIDDFPRDSLASEDLPDASPAPAPVEPKRQAKGKWRVRLLMALVPLLLLATGGYFWLTSGRYVSTDNAYVQQDRVSVAAEVGGRIVEIGVKENQSVKAGDLLFRLDPEPYELAIRQANADIASAQVSLQGMSSDYRATGAEIEAAREDIRFAKIDLERQQALMERGFTTRARLDEAQHKLEQARARLDAAEANSARARARLATGSAMPGVNPAIAEARLDRDAAELNLRRSIVRAPFAGRIVQTERLQQGQMMVAGIPAVTIVADDKSWIEANFKETDLAHMEVGQPAEVRFDAYPDMKLAGVVESIGAGTGAEFSVLPPQNATGNWVKVTQRVPVRIRITGTPPRRLIAGLSVEVTVDTDPKGER